MPIGSCSRHRIAAVIGLCVLAVLPSLEWGGVLGPLVAASNSPVPDGLITSAPTSGSVGGTVVVVIPVGAIPFGMAFDSRNGYTYVVDAAADSVSLIDGTTVVATVHVAGFSIAFLATSLSFTSSVISELTKTRRGSKARTHVPI